MLFTMLRTLCVANFLADPVSFKQKNHLSNGPLRLRSPLPRAYPGRWTIEAMPESLFKDRLSAQRRFFEFLTAKSCNPSTRLGYARRAAQFLSWCETRNLNFGNSRAFAVPNSLALPGSTTEPVTVCPQWHYAYG